MQSHIITFGYFSIYEAGTGDEDGATKVQSNWVSYLGLEKSAG